MEAGWYTGAYVCTPYRCIGLPAVMQQGAIAENMFMGLQAEHSDWVQDLPLSIHIYGSAHILWLVQLSSFHCISTPSLKGS